MKQDIITIIWLINSIVLFIYIVKYEKVKKERNVLAYLVSLVDSKELKKAASKDKSFKVTEVQKEVDRK